MFLQMKRVITKKQACYFSESQKTRLVLNISDLRYLRPSPAKNRPINQTKSTKNKNTKISLCKYSRKRTYPYNSKFSADF